MTDKQLAVFPCRLRILSSCIFIDDGKNCSIDIIVDDGILKQNTPLVIQVGKGLIDIGILKTMKVDGTIVCQATHGQKVCINVDDEKGDKKMYGRRFDCTTPIMSKINRQSVDACKTHFRNDLGKDDWRLMKFLKEDIFCFQ